MYEQRIITAQAAAQSIAVTERQLYRIVGSFRSGGRTPESLAYQSHEAWNRTDRETEENIRFANSLGIEIRLSRDLDRPHHSEQIIQEIIAEEELELKGVEMGTADSSAYRQTYANAAMHFTLKRIQEVYLKGMCDNCAIIDRCREYFYGIRVEPDGRIRLCIHRDDPGALMTVEEFLQGPLFQSVKQAYYPWKGETS